MSNKYVAWAVFEDAGLTFYTDGIYFEDFGTMQKLVDYTETWWESADGCPHEILEHPA